MKALRRGREGYAADERILGGSDFVEHVRPEGEAKKRSTGQVQRLAVEDVVKTVCEAARVRLEEVTGGGRRRAVCRVRAGAAYLWIEWLGRSGPPVARELGIQPQAGYRVAQRGRAEAAHWQRVLETS